MSSGGLTKEEKFLELAQKRLKRCIEADDHNRKGAVEDLKFLNGEQWDSAELQRRHASRRPALKVNLLPKFVDQVVGDERHNRPRIKIKPLSSDSSAKIAKIREGIIATIEYNSNADSIYDQAFEQMVSGRYGAWRVLTRWCDDDPWVQEIYLERIPNPMVAYLDPDAKDAMGSDAKFGFILEKVPREEFEERYPEADLPSDAATKSGAGMQYEHWYDKDTVTVAEYYVMKEVEKTICQMKDGSVMYKDDADAAMQEWDVSNKEEVEGIQTAIAMEAMGSNPPMPPGMEGAGAMAAMQGSRPRPGILRSRKVKVQEVRHYLITAHQVISGAMDYDDDKPKKVGMGERLEGHKVPGNFIPIVLLKGRERNIEGKTYIRSLITDAKDPQQLLNYWTTSAAEVVALAPKAPWIGTPKQFAGFENDYASANVENFPLLKYNPDPAAPGPPQRNHPGNPPMAIFTQIAEAKENIKSVIGMFNVDVGDQTPERTGLAVQLKQKPGDVGTYSFIDNLTRAVVYTGKIINSMIPEVYDSERDVRLRMVDDTESFIPINTTTGTAMDKVNKDPSRYNAVKLEDIRTIIRDRGTKAKFNDISAGKYDVAAVVGPSYATQRQEAGEAMLRLATAMPRKMEMALDLIVKNLDIKDGEELAERFRKMLPPGMNKPKPGEPPSQPLPPPPQILLQIEKMKTEGIKQQAVKFKAIENMVKMLKEMKEGDEEVKEQVIGVLMELLQPEHPADQKLQQGTGLVPGQQPGQGQGAGPVQQAAAGGAGAGGLNLLT